MSRRNRCLRIVRRRDHQRFRRHLACGERLRGARGRNDHFAVRRNPHRQFGIDESQRLGTQRAEQKRHAGQADFRFRRARDDCLVMVAHHDVAQAYRDPDPPCAFDLGAADLDGVVAPEVLLDGGGKPRGDDVKIDRPRAETQPQSEKADAEDDGENAESGESPAQPDGIENPMREPCERRGQAMQAYATALQQTACLMAALILPLGSIPMASLRSRRFLRLRVLHCLTLALSVDRQRCRF